MASITTTISVKDQATQEYKKIHQELLKYQEQHSKTVAQIDKDNKQLTAVENKLKNDLETIQKQRAESLRKIADTRSASTTKELKELRESINEQKTIYKTSSENDKAYIDAKKYLLENDATFTRNHYDKQIQQQKEILNEELKLNNIRRNQNQQNLELIESQLTQQESLLSKSAIVLQEETKAAQQKEIIRLKDIKLAKEQEEATKDLLFAEQKRQYAELEAANAGKVTSDQLINKLIKNKENIAQVKELTSSQKDLLFAEQKRQYAELEAANAGKVTLAQLKEKISLQKQSQEQTPATQFQKNSFADEQYKQYKEQLRLEEDLSNAQTKKNQELKENFRRTYENTAAQNRYNDSFAKLNTLYSQGTISKQQFNNALKQEKTALSESERATTNTTNALVRHMRQIETAIVGFYMFKTAWDKTIGVGITAAKIVENNTDGIAALISANTKMTDSMGNVLSPIEKFTKAQKDAKNIIADIRAESSKTAATFPELLSVFQQGIGKTLSMGNAFGATTAQIEKNTIKLSARMVNFASALGMPMDRVLEEMRSLVAGSASSDSLMSMILFGSPAKANTAIREAEKSANGVADLLEKTMKPFDVLADTKTWDKSIKALTNSWQSAMEKVVEDSGAFKEVTNLFYEMSNDITKNTDSIVRGFDGLYANVKTVFAMLNTDAAEYAAILGGVALTLNLIKKNPITSIVLATAGTQMAFEAQEQEKQEAERKAKKEAMQKVADNIESQAAVKGLIKDYSKQKAINEEKIKTAPTQIFGTDKEIENLKKETQDIEYILELLEKQKDIKDEDRAIVQKTLKDREQYATLRQKDKSNEEENKKIAEDILKTKGKTFELEDEIAKLNKSKAIDLKNLKAEEDFIKGIGKGNLEAQASIAKIKQDIANKDILIGLKQKEIAEENQKASDKATQSAETALNKKIELNKKDAEHQSILTKISLIQSGQIDEEQQKLSLIDVRLKGLEKEYSILSNGMEKDKVHLEILNTQIEASIALQKAEEKRFNAIEKIADKIKDTVKDYKELANTTIENTDTNLDEFISPEEYAAAREKINADYLSAESKIQLAKIQAEAELNKTNLNDMSKIFDKHAQDIASATNNTGYKSSEAIKFDTDGKKAEILKEYEDQMYLLEEASKDAKDKLNETFRDRTIKIDFQLEGFDQVTESIAGLANSYAQVANSQEAVNAQQKILEAAKKDTKKDTKDIIKQEKLLAKMQYQQATDQIGAYGDMAGAIKSFAKEGSKEYQALAKVQKIMYTAEFAMNAAKMVQQAASTSLFVASKTAEATAAGTVAVLNQGTGDPYTAFGRMAAMAAIVASIGVAIGTFAGGGNKTTTTTTKDSFSKIVKNEGTGTVLGDKEAQSESIVNAMEILKDYAKPEYQTLLSMNRYLKNISDNIGGVTSLLIQSGAYDKAFGGGFTATSMDTGWQGLGVSYKKLGNKITSKVEGLFTSVMGDSLGGITGKLYTLPLNTANKILSSALNGIFGKTSTAVSSKLTDSGLLFGDQLLSNAKNEIFGSMYQNITTKKTTSKKSWFGSSSSTSKDTDTNIYGLEGNTEIERQFSLILDNMYNATFEASKALDFTAEEITNTLDNFVVSIGRVSLYGLNGDQIQERLQAVFGAIGDNLAKTAFPLLVGFQKVGEGMFETMSRVATGMESAEYYINRLGSAFEDVKYTDIINQQGDVGFEALLQSMTKFEESIYGVDGNLLQLIQSLDTTAEELYTAYSGLDYLRDLLIFMGQSGNALSASMIKGAGSIDALQEGFSSYFENFLTDEEQLKFNTAQLRDEFAKINVAMPTSKDGFSALVKGIDTSTEAGQELYGRLIILSEGFEDVADSAESMMKSISNSFLDTINTIEDAINELLGKTTNKNSLDTQMQQYFALSEQAQALTAKGSGISATERETLNTLGTQLGGLSLKIQDLFPDNKNITSNLVVDLTTLNSQIMSINKSILAKGFSDGGYTGAGNKFDAKGIVHADEYVVNSEKLNAIGGVSRLEAMINQGIQNRKAMIPTNNNSYSTETNNKSAIIQELQIGQKALVGGINAMIKRMDDLVDYTNERRENKFPVTVSGSVSIAG